jgi:hypothetical protein
MKQPSRSSVFQRVGPNTISNRITNDVFVDGVWYKDQPVAPSHTPSVTPSATPTSSLIELSPSPTPLISPTPTPTPSSVVPSWIYTYTYISPTQQNYISGPVTVQVVVNNGTVSLLGKTINWMCEDGFEGTATFSNQVDSEFASQVLITPSGDGGAVVSIDSVTDANNDIAYYV